MVQTNVGWQVDVYGEFKVKSAAGSSLKQIQDEMTLGEGPSHSRSRRARALRQPPGQRQTPLSPPFCSSG